MKLSAGLMLCASFGSQMACLNSPSRSFTVADFPCPVSRLDAFFPCANSGHRRWAQLAKIRVSQEASKDLFLK